MLRAHSLGSGQDSLGEARDRELIELLHEASADQGARIERSRGDVMVQVCGTDGPYGVHQGMRMRHVGYGKRL